MLTFLHPYLLWLLPLALVPLLLHLLSRALPPRLLFPTTHFLLHSPRPQYGRRKWREWLLMLCRMALLALFALAIAAPEWQPKYAKTRQDNAQSATPPALVILLDASASMQGYAAQAKSSVNKLLAQHASWESALFLLDQEAMSLPTENLAHWQPGYAETHTAPALRRAAQWLNTHKSAPHRALAIVSDFQRSNWAEIPPALPAGTEFLLEDVSASGNLGPNASLTTVHATPLGETKLRVRASWRNWSDAPQTRTLRIVVGDTPPATQSITLSPHTEGATAVVLDWTPVHSRGLATLEPPDTLPADDQAFFWAQTVPPIPVLLLLPDDPTDAQLADELEFFLQRALTAERAGIPGHFSVQSLGASALPLVDLQNFALIILAGSAERLTTDAAIQLHDYLERGGGLLCIPGAAPLLAWHFLQQNDFLDTPAQGLLRQTTGLDEIPENTLLAPVFPTNAPSDLHLFSIRQILRTTPPQSSTILLKTLDKLPALYQLTTQKNGAAFAFTFPLHTAVTDFPLSQSFLPVLREIATAATRGHSDTIRLHCGTPFPQLLGLDGTPLTPSLLTDTALPGLARLGPHPVEINVSPKESAPAKIDLAELQRLLGKSAQMTAEQTTTSPDAALPATRPLRPWCFGLLALFALLELLLQLPARRASSITSYHDE